MPYPEEFAFFADPSIPAATIRRYAERLKQQETVPSIADGKDDGDKQTIINELEMAADDIADGNIRVGDNTLSGAWTRTANEFLLFNMKPGNNRTYRRALTVVRHIHHALFEDGDPATFTLSH